MRGIERFFVLGAVIYMAVYIPCFVLAMASPDPDKWLPVIIPCHILGMILNFIAIVLTIRDLYLRKFKSENAKLTWALLILMTGGIGWLVYIFKHALKPRGKKETE